MYWLATIDSAAFRFVNQSLANPVFDRLMPFLSGNPFFAPALVGLITLLLWRGGSRGRLCVAMLLLLVLVLLVLLLLVLLLLLLLLIVPVRGSVVLQTRPLPVLPLLLSSSPMLASGIDLRLGLMLIGK